MLPTRENIPKEIPVRCEFLVMELEKGFSENIITDMLTSVPGITSRMLLKVFAGLNLQPTKLFAMIHRAMPNESDLNRKLF